MDSENPDFLRAKGIALRYIARKSRTVQQMREHLKQKGVAEEVIGPVIDFCLDRRYLDDSTFATFFAHDALHLRKYGRRRIDLELSRRGISEETRQEVLEKTFEEVEEVETARALVAKRFAGKDLSDIKARNRVIRFLERRGYSWEVIEKVVPRV